MRAFSLFRPAAAAAIAVLGVAFVAPAQAQHKFITIGTVQYMPWPLPSPKAPR